MSTPRILAAAIRQDGRVFIGKSHAAIIHHIVETTFIRPVTGEQGFVVNDVRQHVTSRGEWEQNDWVFVDRIEGRRIALDAGQIKEPTHHRRDLFSEDINYPITPLDAKP